MILNIFTNLIPCIWPKSFPERITIQHIDEYPASRKTRVSGISLDEVYTVIISFSMFASVIDEELRIVNNSARANTAGTQLEAVAQLSPTSIRQRAALNIQRLAFIR